MHYDIPKKTTRKFHALWVRECECGNFSIFEHFSHKHWQITSNFALLVMQSNHKNIFRTKHDGISSILMWNQWGDNPIYGPPVGPNTQILTKKCTQILVGCKYLHHLNHLIMISQSIFGIRNIKNLGIWPQEWVNKGVPLVFCH